MKKIKQKQKHKYPNGNPGFTKDTAKIKKMYNEVIVNKNAEINYLKKQYKGTILRMQKVLSAYHGSTTSNVFHNSGDIKFCPCCGQKLTDTKE
jgi:hypothetical protein